MATQYLATESFQRADGTLIGFRELLSLPDSEAKALLARGIVVPVGKDGTVLSEASAPRGKRADAAAVPDSIERLLLQNDTAVLIKLRQLRPDRAQLQQMTQVATAQGRQLLSQALGLALDSLPAEAQSPPRIRVPTTRAYAQAVPRRR